MNTFLKLISFVLKCLSLVSVKLAANVAFDLFQRPRIRKIRSHEQKFFDKHPARDIPSAEGNVKCYEVGKADGPLVVLVHGWESNAASMSGIGAALAEEGFHVVSFDTPAHGQSEETRVNLMTMANHMRAVLKEYAGNKSFSVVAHSFGSITSSYALSKEQYKVDQLLYLTSPMNLESIFVEYKGMVNLSDRVYKALVDKAESILGESLQEVTMLNKTAMIDYAHLTLIHDKNDRMLDFKNSEVLAAGLERTTLNAIEESGHYRMLWDKRVIEKCVDLIASRERVSADA